MTKPDKWLVATNVLIVLTLAVMVALILKIDEHKNVVLAVHAANDEYNEKIDYLWCIWGTSNDAERFECQKKHVKKWGDKSSIRFIDDEGNRITEFD